MKTHFILAITFFIMISTKAQTPYAYFPYNDGSPFVMPTDKVEADLENVWDASWVVLGSHFDKSSTGTTALLTDLNKTYVKGASNDAIVIGNSNGWTPPRVFSETTGTSVAGTGLRWRTDSKTFDNTAWGAIFYYTVTFTETTDYNLYIRKRGGNKGDYAVYIYNPADMSTAVHSFTFNTAPLAKTSALGTSSTNGTCQMSYISVNTSPTGTDNSSNWIKVKTAATIAAGTYVVKVHHKGDNWNGAFGGFVFLKVPASTKPTVSISAPANNSYNNSGDVITLQAEATASAGRTISSVVFYNGATNIGSGIYNSGNNRWEIAYALPGGKSIITAVATDNTTELNTSPELTAYASRATSGAYKTRASWNERIEAEDFDYGGANVAFKDFSIQAGSLSYRDDGKDQGTGTSGAVQLENANSNRSNGANICWTAPGDWTQYTIPDIDKPLFDIVLNHANPNPQTIRIWLNDQEIGTFAIPATGGWFTFKETLLFSMNTKPTDSNNDPDVIKLEWVDGSVNVDYFSLEANFVSKKEIDTPKAVSAYCSGNKLQIVGSISNNATATLFDLSGRTKASFKLNQGNFNTLNISNLNNGIYMLHISDETHSENLKVLIDK